MNGRVLRILYQPYKWLVYLPLFVISTVAFILLGMPIIALFGPDAANRIAGRGWARFNGFITPMRVNLVGRENIQKGRSYVVVANHQSSYDIFVLWGYLGIDARWVIKKELRRIPLFGLAGKLGGNIYIDRSDRRSARESLAGAGKILKNGVSVIMLPEGTRSRDGKLREFRKGAFAMSLALGIPVLPVTIVDTRHILPPGTLDLFPGRVTLVVHKPLPGDEYGEDRLDDFIRDVRDVIQKGIDRHARFNA